MSIKKAKAPPLRAGFTTKGPSGAFMETSRKPLSPAERARAALARMTDEEDAAITADALADPDNPPADDLFRRRGRPRAVNPKEAVNLRLDGDVLAHFRAEGPGWQTRINEALRKAAKL